MSGHKTPVLIDCDPGYDDMIALLLALGSSELDVKGVSTVSGNCHVNSAYLNALRVVRRLNQAIPVAKGAASPILRPLETAPEVHGTVVEDYGFLSEVRPSDKAEESFHLLCSVLEESDSKVTVVATGPLTNLALAISLKPSLKDRIKRLVFMGGAIFEGNKTASAEFNMYVDPEAAHIILNSGLPLTMVGLNVTHKALIYPEEMEALRRYGDAGAFTGAILEKYFSFYSKRGFPGNPLHDVLAVAGVVSPEILSTRPLRVDVETRGDLTRGRTVVDFNGVSGLPPNCDVALETDRDKFIDLLFSKIGGLSSKV